MITEKLFDTHAHYFDERFEDFADKILVDEVFGGNVGKVINVGTNNKNNLTCIEQARKYENMYVALGIHPDDCQYLEGSPSDEVAILEDMILREMEREDSRVVAIGEIGYDFHYEGFDREKQREYFERQMQLAEKLSLPVCVHDREAHGPCFDMVLAHPGVKGVFHSYSGSAEMAIELVKRGWYISFSGVLTFKNARKAVEVAESLPIDRILIETDTPYLAPHPHRGQINHSGLVRHTAEKLAEIKGMSANDIADVTFDNASRLFFQK